MPADNVDLASVKRVMVATDRSSTADRAVGWATRLAAAYEAELLLLQVLAHPGDDADVAGATADLQSCADGLAGTRGRARVVVDEDPAQAILDAAADERVDVVVVGNVGMSGRKQFLLGNIPNRISHNARCSVVIVNTIRHDGQPNPAGSASRRRSKTGSDLEEGQLLRRAWRIGWILARTGAGAIRSSSKDSDGSRTRLAARRFREALDQLGPTFAKLGQILSTRPDLLPPSFVEELATLQERVTPLTEPEVVAVMERELGVPWEDVFASIEPVPLAAGTIAQVHRATLENGDRVVVKVQRPTAEQDIQQDLALLELLGQKAAERPAFRRAIDLPAMIDHLASSLRKELDFGNEAANMKRMREVLAPFSRLDVPAVYDDYSTARLLVMQEIQGGPVQNAPPGAARQEAARQLLERLALGTDYRDFGLVFTIPGGGPIHHQNLSCRDFAHLTLAAGVPKIRFHDLRHTSASLLLGANVNAKIVSERLGHSSISITLDTYSHVLPTMQREASDTLGRILAAAT